MTDCFWSSSPRLTTNLLSYLLSALNADPVAKTCDGALEGSTPVLEGGYGGLIATAYKSVDGLHIACLSVRSHSGNQELVRHKHRPCGVGANEREHRF